MKQQTPAAERNLKISRDQHMRSGLNLLGQNIDYVVEEVEVLYQQKMTVHHCQGKKMIGGFAIEGVHAHYRHNHDLDVDDRTCLVPCKVIELLYFKMYGINI